MKKLVVFIFVCFATSTFAQENLNPEIIDVIKDFRPKIMQAHKIKSQPQFIDTSKVTENLQYKLRFENFKVTQKLDSLGALILKRNEFSKLFNKHVELGLGTLLNPHLAFDISNGLNTKSLYQVYLNYDGAFSKLQDSQDIFSFLNFGGFYKRVFDKFSIESDLFFTDDFRFDSLDTSYRNTFIDFNSTFYLTDTSSVLVPKHVNVSSETFFQATEFVESKLALSVYHKNSNQHLNWSFSNDLTLQQSSNLNAVHWESELTSSKKRKRTLFSYGLQSDLLNSDFKLFPEVRVQYELLSKALFVYTEVGGDRVLYTLNRIYSENPYSNRSLLFENNDIPSNTKYFARIGINGTLFKGVSYQISIEGNKQDGFLDFVRADLPSNGSNRSLLPRFTTVNMVNLNAQADAKINEKWQLSLKGELRSFDRFLSFVPESNIGLYSNLKLNNQYSLISSIRYTGAREYLLLASDLDSYLTPYAINPFVDINVKLNYSLNTKLGFYLEGFNLLNNNIEFWQHSLITSRCLNFGANYKF